MHYYRKVCQGNDVNSVVGERESNHCKLLYVTMLLGEYFDVVMDDADLNWTCVNNSSEAEWLVVDQEDAVILLRCCAWKHLADVTFQSSSKNVISKEIITITNVVRINENPFSAKGM